MIGTLTLFSLALASFSSSALEAPVVMSRNMPTNCDFVFHVESDVRIEGMSGPIVFALLDHFTQRWSEPREMNGAEATFVSFSQNPKALYRVMRFWTKGDEEHAWESEFARQFGEACRWGGRDETPFRRRVVTEAGAHGPATRALP